MQVTNPVEAFANKGGRCTVAPFVSRALERRLNVTFLAPSTTSTTSH